jgi:NitT/TauT family transport system substrate-binding protein
LPFCFEVSALSDGLVSSAPAAVLWKKAQNASESVDELFALLSDPGFEFTSQPHRIAYFAAFLNRIGTMKSKVGDWKELFWETAYNQQGD